MDPKPRKREDTKEREKATIKPRKIRSDTLTVNGRKRWRKGRYRRGKRSRKMQ
jgi:hypothetical protein